jgi:hypothetical protein
MFHAPDRPPVTTPTEIQHATKDEPPPPNASSYKRLWLEMYLEAD